MEIKKVITIDKLTKDSVSVIEQKIYADGNSEYSLGEPVRTAFTPEDIDILRNKVPDPYYTAIVSVWGMNEAESEDAENEQTA